MNNIKKILKKTVRVINNAGITQPGQFKFDDGSGMVDANLPYHIRYTRDLKEYYFSGKKYSGSSKLINRIKGSTIFSSYFNAKNNKLNPTKFYSPIVIKPTLDDFKTGFFLRYFVKQSSNINANIFEINKTKYDEKNIFYKKIKINWKLTGLKSDVLKYNYNSMLQLNNFFEVNINLNPLQFWERKLTNKEKTLKKLKRL